MKQYATEPSLNLISGFDPIDLRRALGTFATGIAVATTTAQDGTPVGMTVNSFTSVSLDPPLVLFCVANSSAGVDVYVETEHFCINILSADQNDVSAVFAMRGADKFRSVDWRFGRSGVPVIDGAAVHLECKVYKRFVAGDHLVLIGCIQDYAYADRAPLCFWRGGYAHLEPQGRDAAPSGGGDIEAPKMECQS